MIYGIFSSNFVFNFLYSLVSINMYVGIDISYDGEQAIVRSVLSLNLWAILRLNFVQPRNPMTHAL